MKDSEIDEVLRRGAEAPGDVDAALVERISKAIGANVRPVRPLAPTWILVSGLVVASAVTAIVVAALFGFHGIRVLDATEIAVIFCVLGLLIWNTAISSVGQMTPGAAIRIPGPLQPAIASLVLVGAFAALFRDYNIDRFVPRGIACLTAGIVTAVPASIAAWILLRRGFAVNRRSAGLVFGTLAGLAGITMLELHCANLQVLHIVVWHTAVAPLMAVSGALFPSLVMRTRFGRRRLDLQ